MISTEVKLFKLRYKYLYLSSNHFRYKRFEDMHKLFEDKYTMYTP